MATLMFTGYEVRDDGVSLAFHHGDPGPGRDTTVQVLVTDAELAGVTTAAQLRTLITAKLQRKLQATNIASKLDPFIGQTVTV